MVKVRRKLVDPGGEYQAVKKIISSECWRVSHFYFDGSNSSDERAGATEEGYLISNMSFTVLDSIGMDSCSNQDIHIVYPGITSIRLHISRIPTRSILTIKTENFTEGCIHEQFYTKFVDLSGLDVNVLRGLSSRKIFKLCFDQFVAETSEFHFSVLLLESAVVTGKHHIDDIPNKQDATILNAYGYFFHTGTYQDSDLDFEKKKEDIEWFHGQIKKYHVEENLPEAPFPLQHADILPALRNYQKEAINWMLCREGVISGYDATNSTLMDNILDKMYAQVELKKIGQDEFIPAFYNPYIGYCCLEKPTLRPLPSGGILADEMGLGKTVEVLSLILLHPRPSKDETKIKNENEHCETIHHFQSIQTKKRASSPCEFETMSHIERQEKLLNSSPQKKRKVEIRITEEINQPEKVPNDHNDASPSTILDIHESASEVPSGDNATTTAKIIPASKKRRKRVKSRGVLKKKNTNLTKKKNIRRIDQKLAKQNKRNELKQKDLPDGKGGTYSKVKPMYDAALGEYAASQYARTSTKFHGAFFDTNIGRKAYFECICGEGLEDQSKVVTCMICSSSQHEVCVGINQGMPKLENYLCPHCAVTEPPIDAKTTLIITPNTIANQWIKEIRKHVKQENKRILFYKGVSKHGYVPPIQLTQYDLIITTYGVLSQELNYVDLPHSNSAEGRRFRNPKRFLTVPSPLPCISWWRVCLDEAQMVEGITTRMSNMARKLKAVHYWCVTGTPISKGLQDLYGLFLFLRVSPIDCPFWWDSLVAQPFYRKDVSLAYELFGNLIWRNGKRDVLDQMGIPPQTEIVHWLNFSPVESHFYERLHGICRARIMEKLTKICGNSQEGLTLRLSNLDRRTLHELLAPFLELRQACCHPQLVRGHILSINMNKTLTMEDILKQLIQKTKLQCQEDHRAIVAALNGAAGIHWLLNEFVEASDKYREILQLSTKYQHLFATDTLQMLHTLENLADLLDMNCAGVPFTLRDEDLRKDAEILHKKFLEGRANGVKNSVDTCRKATVNVTSFTNEFKCKKDSWWVSVVYYAAKHDLADELISRIKDALAVYASRKSVTGAFSNKFKGPQSFQHAVIEKISELENHRMNVLETLESLHSVDPKTLVNAAIECHLRKQQGTKTQYDFQCRLCSNFAKFSEYQQILFSEDKANVKNAVVRTGRNRAKIQFGNKKLTAEEEHLALMQEEEELIANTGDVLYGNISHDSKMLKDAEVEIALRQVLAFARINGLPEDIMEDGSTHLKLFESFKKEFKAMRAVWNQIFDQVSALDELSQATTRIALRPDVQEPQPGSSSTSTVKPKNLSRFDKEKKEKEQTLNLVSRYELRPKLEELKLDNANGVSNFGIHHGQLIYLQNLEKKSYGKKGTVNEEDCPICHNVLGSEWCVLPCGHSFCSDCLKRSMSSQAQSFLCPLCRQETKVKELSFVDTRLEEKDASSSSSTSTNATSSDTSGVSRAVRGSHSSKVLAVVKQLHKLEMTHPGEKVLIFSSWAVVLDIIGRALEENDILYSGLNTTDNKRNFQKALTKFQQKDDVQVLLLPISSGSKGLNIIEATHVFLVEPLLNLGSELQAIGRVHRIGQTKPTFVHRFYIHNTIEEQLFQVLKNHDVSSDDEGLLSLADLKNLVSNK